MAIMILIIEKKKSKLFFSLYKELNYPEPILIFIHFQVRSLMKYNDYLSS